MNARIQSQFDERSFVPGWSFAIKDLHRRLVSEQAMATCLFPVSQALRGHHGDDQAPTDLVDYAQLDAFTSEPFRGNPAAVCLLPIARSKEWMQNVAAEFSAPMTAFLVKRTSSFGNGTSNGEDAPNGYSTAGELHAICKLFVHCHILFVS